MKPKMIVFVGGQGSGKGTFAKLLLQKRKFNYVEAGDILRHMSPDSEIAQKISHGELLDDKEISDIISNYIIENQDIILDGFPRTIGQAKWLIQKYSDKFDIKIVFLDISEEKMIAHIHNRIKEGGNRSDDNDESAVHKRIESFKTITMPAIKWLSQQDKVKFYDIVLPGDDIDTNFNYIIETIK